MIGVIAKFIFDTKAGQFTALAALFAALFGTWLIRHDAKVARKATSTVIETAKQRGKVANEKAQQVIRDAERPGASKRLLSDACRDCDAGVMSKLAPSDRK